MNLFSLGAPNWFWEAINGLWLMICEVIYSFINVLYRVFTKVAEVNLFSTEVFEKITGRIYVVMGIAMLFVFAYNLVLMIINPDDKKSTGAMTKVVKETIISLVAIVLLPTIFNYMYIFQNHIIETNIIGQLIMGGVGNTSNDTSNCDPNDYECTCDFSKFEELETYQATSFWLRIDSTKPKVDIITQECNNYKSSSLNDSERGARTLTPTIFSAFYRPAQYTFEDCANYMMNNDTTLISDPEHQKVCVNFFYDVTMSKYTGDIVPFLQDSFLNAKISDSNDETMEFDWLWAIIAGGLAVWMFLCYAMEIGVRVAKLGVLQIISPITVMMRVVPGQKEKVYDKWYKQLLNTYLDVFIRLLIIYFALFAISLVPDVLDTMWNSIWDGDKGLAENFVIKPITSVIVILGILKFAQEAPSLLKEFFGGMGGGNFALRSPAKQFNDNKYAKGILGGAASLATVKSNQFKNLKKDWTSDKATFGSRARQLTRLVNPVSGFKKGFDGTKDASSLDAWGKGVSDSSVEYLKDKGFIYKSRQSLTNTMDNLRNISGKSYLTQDTAALQRVSGELGVIADNAKIILKSLEDDPKFQGLVQVYDQAIKDATKTNPGIVDALTKEKVDAMNALRSKLMVEKLTGKEATIKYEKDGELLKAIIDNNREATKGISTELKTTLENLTSSIQDNFETFNETIIDSKTQFAENLRVSEDSYALKLDDLKRAIEQGDTKVIKTIKTAADDGAKAAKAAMINIEKSDKK